jgi:glycosyltransferase involved in cell wall biosynthesis
MNKRVALLFATSGYSGVDRVVANLLPEFGRNKYNFNLLLIRSHGPYLKSVPSNVRIFKLKAGSKRTILPALAWYLWRYHPEALLTANHHLNRAALLARKLTKSRTRIAIRMGMSLTAKGQDMTLSKREALFASMQRWYPEADAVIAPSTGVGEDLVSIAGVSPHKLHVIRNPIVNERLYSLASEPVDHPWLTSPDCPVIVSVGSLEPRKDFSTLIRAFASIRFRQRCRLVILGEGGERGKLLRLAEKFGLKEDVDLPGFKQNPYPYMRNASVFVLSSRREGASAVIVEALACGTPVVSTDCPSGPAETLKDGQLGRLVPVGDYEAMAAAILNTLIDPSQSEALEKAAEEHATAQAAKRYLQAMGLEGV